ncbi:MAG: hypothetical protein QOE48_6060 [Mycobacterium sp.]|jgi:hypothetical protein|nr:hypothetical protein [Mycobacterium sp.]
MTLLSILSWLLRCLLDLTAVLVRRALKGTVNLLKLSGDTGMAGSGESVCEAH